MGIFQAFLLGIVQGITEFLPISSSGHLLLLPKVINMPDQGLAVDALLHLATGLAIITYFYKDWWKMLTSWRTNKLLRKIIVASIPAAIIGLLFQGLIESYLRSAWVVVIMLLVVAGVMWWVEENYTEVRKVDDGKRKFAIGWVESLIVGFAQVIALIPGTSRSGITISAGMWQKVTRADAAKFTFLLAVPVTIGAGLLKLPDVLSDSSVDMLPLVVAVVTTFSVAYITMNWLLKYLKSNTLKPFVYYRIVLAVLVAIFLLF